MHWKYIIFGGSDIPFSDTFVLGCECGLPTTKRLNTRETLEMVIKRGKYAAGLIRSSGAR